MAADVFSIDGVDELFEGDLGDFVARRDELVKRLRKAGDAEAAAAVKGVRKPSTVAWAVNQVARQAPDQVDALMAAGRAVETAQAKAVQGKGDGGLQAATRQWRNRVQALASEAARLAGEQYRDEAATTFQAGSVDEESGALLKAGRLTAALTFAGFGLASMPEPAEPLPGGRERRSERERVDEVEPEEPEFDEAAIREAEKLLDAREAALEKATNRLRRAEQRLEVAQKSVEEAEAAHADSMQELDEAADALRRATRR